MYANQARAGAGLTIEFRKTWLEAQVPVLTPVVTPDRGGGPANAYCGLHIAAGAAVLYLVMPGHSWSIWLYVLGVPVGFLSVVFDPFKLKRPER